MRVYKYRGGDEKTFRRDLIALRHNFFYSPRYNKLNDPYETSVLRDKFKIQAGLINKIYRKSNLDELNKINLSHKELINRKNDLGIYSLSKKYDDELMWSFYSNSHKGFCIEYCLDELVNNNVYDKRYFFEVKYSKKPPQLGLEFIDRRPQDIIKIVKILAGTKSLKWKHEKEVRIITNNIGIHSYNFKAIKAIYFGLKMTEKHKKCLMEVLKGRNIKFYQIKRIHGLYKLEKVSIPKTFRDDIYFKEIPPKYNNGIKVNIKLLDIKYDSLNKKGTINIEIETEASEKALKWLSKIVKNDLFYTAKNIYIFYRLKNTDPLGVAWATFHYTPSLEIKMLGITEKDWNKMKNIIPSGKLIKSWMDREVMAESIIHLVKHQNSISLQIIYRDLSIRNEKLIETLNDELIRYDYENNHGEYYCLEKNGNLGFYNSDGKWKEAVKL